MGEKSLLTETEVEAEFGIPRKTLQWKRYVGQDPPFVKLGTSVRYRRQDLDTWIAENIRRSTSDTAEIGGAA